VLGQAEQTHGLGVFGIEIDGPGQMNNGGRIIGGVVLDHAEIEVEIGIMRVLVQRNVEVRPRLLELAAVKIGEPEFGVCLGGVERAELGKRIGAAVRDYCFEDADGFVIVTFVEETDPAMILLAGRTPNETAPE
jgi:hypothetical protein